MSPDPPQVGKRVTLTVEIESSKYYNLFVNACMTGVYLPTSLSYYHNMKIGN